MSWLAVFSVALVLHNTQNEDSQATPDALLAAFRLRIESEQKTDDERTRTSLASLQAILDDTTSRKSTLLQEVSDLEQSERSHKDVLLFLPWQQRDIDLLALVMGHQHTTIHHVCDLMRAQSASRLDNMTTQYHVTSQVHQRLLDAPIPSATQRLLSEILEDQQTRLETEQVEMADLAVVCSRVKTISMDQLLNRTRAMQREIGARTVNTPSPVAMQQQISSKLAVLKLLDDQSKALMHEISEIENAAAARKQRRDDMVHNVGSLSNMILGLADPTVAREASTAATYIDSNHPPGLTPETSQRTCNEIKMLNAMSRDGVYWIHLDDPENPFRVFCDMTIDGGGWTYVWRNLVPDSASNLNDDNSDRNDIVYSLEFAPPIFRPITPDEKVSAARQIVQNAESPSGSQTASPSSSPSASSSPSPSSSQHATNATDNTTPTIIPESSSPSPSPSASASVSAEPSISPVVPVERLSNLGLSFLVNVDCYYSDLDKLCGLTQVAECIALCDLNAACTHFTYNYNSNDTARFPELNQTVWTDGCCWLKKNVPMCTDKRAVVGKLSGSSYRQSNYLKTHSDFAPLPVSTASGTFHSLVSTESSVGQVPERFSFNSKAYSYFASKQYQEALKSTVLMIQGQVADRQNLLIRLNGVSLSSIYSISEDSSCARVDSTIQMYSPHTQTTNLDSSKPHGCCGEGNSQRLDHLMGQTQWIRSISSLDGTRYLGLASTATDGDMCGQTPVFAQAPDGSNVPLCDETSPLICDFSSLKRLYPSDPHELATISVTSEGADFAITDLFSSKTVYSTEPPSDPEIVQAFAWAFRAQQCPVVNGRVCNSHGHCVDGMCHCVEGWSGLACSLAVCDEPCHHQGQCVAPNVCQCRPGYSGKFCETEMECVAVQVPSSFSGTYQCDGQAVSNVCRFWCPSGTVVKGTLDTSSMTRTCLPNGRWSGEPIDCVHVECSPVGEVPNAQISCSGVTVNNTCTVSCLPGYALANSSLPNVPMTISCRSDGSWSGHPTCSRVSCGPLVTPAHASGTCNSLSYGDVCEYSCQAGYHSEGVLGMVRVCQADGSWSNPGLACVPDSGM